MLSRFLHLTLLISLSALLLSACATVNYHDEKPFPAVEAGKSLVYFYRPSGFIGSSYRFNVYEGDEVVGAMDQNSYFYLMLDPGTHKLYTKEGQLVQSEMVLDVKAGQTRYIRVDVGYQVIGNSVNFVEVDEEQAKPVLKTRKYVTPRPASEVEFNVHPM